MSRRLSIPIPKRFHSLGNEVHAGCARVDFAKGLILHLIPHFLILLIFPDTLDLILDVILDLILDLILNLIISLVLDLILVLVLGLILLVVVLLVVLVVAVLLL